MTFGEHPSAKTLALYVTDPTAIENIDELEDHLRRCNSCGEIVAAAKAFEENFDEAEAWDAQRLVGLPRRPPQYLVDYQQHVRVEDSLAEYLLEPLLRDEHVFARAAVAADREYISAGVVRRLVQESEQLRERNLSFARRLTSAAVLIADSLPRERYTDDDRQTAIGQAWREHANVLRYVGEYPAALTAVDRATAAFQATRVNGFDLARVDFIRGTILWKMEELATALPFARAARSVFAAWGQTEREIHSGLLEGGILFDMGAYREARVIFEQLVAPAEALDDGPTLGLVYNGLGATLQELDELPAAATLFRKALALYDHFGIDVERRRTSWSLALLAVRSGHGGAARLRAVMEQFLAAGNVSDAGLVALDLAQELLKHGAVVEVLHLCNELVARFAAAGMQASAAAAVRFIREAAATGDVPRSSFEHTRGYFRRLRSNADLLFLPPPGAVN